MGIRDPRVDQYIAKSADFAKPILSTLREIVHEACPDAEEGMKWSMPHFLYKGMLCGMAAFKEHATFGFWKGSLVIGDAAKDDAMGHLGRIRTVSDLPSKKALTAYIRKAAALNDRGVKIARAPKRAAAPLRVPSALTAA